MMSIGRRWLVYKHITRTESSTRIFNRESSTFKEILAFSLALDEIFCQQNNAFPCFITECLNLTVRG